MIFFVGLEVDTSRFELDEQLKFETFIAYTWTNVGLLSVLAAFMAYFARSPSILPRLTATGFLIYLLVMTGQSVLGLGIGAEETKSIAIQVSRQQYLRVAASISLLSFLAVYDPALLGSLIKLPLTFIDPNDRHNRGHAVKVDDAKSIKTTREASPSIALDASQSTRPSDDT